MAPNAGDAGPGPAPEGVAPESSALESGAAVALAEAPPPPEAMLTERPAAAPEPPGRAAPVVSGEHGRLWEDLLARVRGRKRMLASFLEHGVPGGLEGETFSALFDNTYYEGMVLRRENLTVIQEELSAAAGRRLVFRARTGTIPGGRPATSGPPLETRRDRPKDLLAENPGLGRIVRELGGQILPGGESTGS
jgi:hypothetical protein